VQLLKVLYAWGKTPDECVLNRFISFHWKTFFGVEKKVGIIDSESFKNTLKKF
jgi:hypothetical protein